MNLEELQSFFLSLLEAPEGVARGLAGLSAAGMPAGDLFSAHFRGDERLGALARVDIYANMYFFRLRDVLAEDFPRTRGVLGETAFHNLVTDFLVAHPPSEPSLRWLGKPLPRHLESSPLTSSFPFLPDLARLEWEWLDCFQALDAPALLRSMLAPVPPAEWPELTFCFRPSVRFLSLEFEVEAFFLESSPPARPVPRPHSLVIFRGEDEEPAFFEIDEAARVFYESLASGRPLAEACSEMAGVCEDLDAGGEAARYLSDAFDRELFSPKP